MADLPDDEVGAVAVPLLWLGVEELSVFSANQFIVQFDEDGFILTAGHVAPPVLLGSPEEAEAQARSLTYVPVQPLGRYRLSRNRLAELIKALQENADRYDRAFESGKE